MRKVLSVKVDESMLRALRQIAKMNLSSIATEVRQAVDAHLQREGFNWRKAENKNAETG
jgi:hypothetical protein